MIPVILRPEPHNFDSAVRQPGHNWLIANGINPRLKPPKGSNLPPYWQKTLKDLWKNYCGVCAYYAIYFEWPIQAADTEHYLAKSKNAAGLAYEWGNFRLACHGANTQKGVHEDILDPIGLRDETFHLRLSDCHIYPNASHEPAYCQKAAATIKRLKLDSRAMRQMRWDHYDSCINGAVSVDYLRKKSPFVWYEAHRQGRL